MPHYCVETGEGYLELTKGAYLAMVRRKNSASKTLPKHKPINSHACLEGTVKKMKVKNHERNFEHRSKPKKLYMLDRMKKIHTFKLKDDSEIF